MKLILDAGALIGIDRNNRRVAAFIELGRRAGAELICTAPVVAQGWRDGARQAPLARALPMIDNRPVGLEEAKSAGELLAAADPSDVVDALLAQLVPPGDRILTSDAGDPASLLSARAIKRHHRRRMRRSPVAAEPAAARTSADRSELRAWPARTPTPL